MHCSTAELRHAIAVMQFEAPHHEDSLARAALHEPAEPTLLLLLLFFLALIPVRFRGRFDCSRLSFAFSRPPCRMQYQKSTTRGRNPLVSGIQSAQSTGRACRLARLSISELVAFPARSSTFSRHQGCCCLWWRRLLFSALRVTHPVLAGYCTERLPSWRSQRSVLQRTSLELCFLEQQLLVFVRSADRPCSQRWDEKSNNNAENFTTRSRGRRAASQAAS